jgi:inhibitor of cysteine peptidase
MFKLSCLLIFSACLAFTGGAFAQGRSVTVGDSDNNTQVNLNVGDKLVVNLTSNLTTGYTWSVASNNQSLLQPLGRNTQSNQTGIIGAPGAQIFRFLAAGAGGEALALVYRRPFEKGVEAARKYRILVTINRQNESKTVTVTDEDNRGSVALNPGDTLMVRLSSNPSTGYSWHVGENNNNLLQPLDESKEPGKSGVLGAPGVQEFKFRAANSGGTRLGLLSQKPSEGGGVPADRKFELTVTINR